LHARYEARGLTTLGISLDHETTAWQAALRHVNMPWQHGQLGADRNSGVSTVPAYWLLDSAGVIVAKVSDPDELIAILDKRLR
jgi:hypothetical protein